jgi:hypothetical protein
VFVGKHTKVGNLRTPEHRLNEFMNIGGKEYFGFKFEVRF